MVAGATCERPPIDRLVGLSYPLDLPADEERDAPFRSLLPQIRKQVREIEAASGLTFDMIASEPSPDDTHDKLLAAASKGKITAGTLVVSFGGDGLANQTVRLFNDRGAPAEIDEATTFFRGLRRRLRHGASLRKIEHS